jgi:DNA-binding NarL/FixJ family response regulator
MLAIIEVNTNNHMITCLAIDDDPLFIKLLEAYFGEYKNITLLSTYTNPIDGIMAVVKQKPDVLLIDIEMPYMDGFEALSTLDKMPKILVISGHLDNPNLGDFDVDKFISKRSLKDADTLKRAIEEVMLG